MRAEDYFDSGVAADDENDEDSGDGGQDTSNRSVRVASPGEQGFFVSIRRKDCKVLEKINFFKAVENFSSRKNAKYLNDNWLANPILLDGKIFILNITKTSTRSIQSQKISSECDLSLQSILSIHRETYFFVKTEGKK